MTTPSHDYSEHLDTAVGHAIEEALKAYLTSGVADRDAITRLQDRVRHIMLLADKVPDALKEMQDAHQENAKAQADAAKASQAKDQPQPKSSAQAPSR